MYGLLDCNNFFASCQRVFRPDLRGKPVVVLSNNDGCVVARSNEAKALDIPMGAPLFRVKDIIKAHRVNVFSANYPLYLDMSHRVMSLLSSLCPQIEVYSIDEAFIDFSGIPPDQLLSRAAALVQTVTQGTGIPVSLGVAPTRTLAKMGSHFAKKYPGYRGVCFIDTPRQRAKALQCFPMDDIWGIGRRSAKKLEEVGVRTAWDFTQLPAAWVEMQFTKSGLQIWRELRGEPCLSLSQTDHKQSIRSSRSFAKPITRLELLQEAVANFAATCGRGLRRQHSGCRCLSVYAQGNRFRTDAPPLWCQRTVWFEPAQNTDSALVQAATQALAQEWELLREPPAFKQAGVTVACLVPEAQMQPNLFTPAQEQKQQQLQQTVDRINRQMGSDTLRLAAQSLPGASFSRSAYRSPAYTTCIDDILKVK